MIIFSRPRLAGLCTVYKSLEEQLFAHKTIFCLFRKQINKHRNIISNTHQCIPEEKNVPPNKKSFLTKVPSSSSSSSDSSWGSTISSWRVRSAAILFAATMVFATSFASPVKYAYSNLNGGKKDQLGSSNDVRKMESGVIVSADVKSGLSAP